MRQTHLPSTGSSSKQSPRSEAQTAAPRGNGLLAHLEARRPEMIALIGTMVQQESPTSNKPAVDALGGWLAAELEKLGGKLTAHRVADFGDHLQADFPGGPRKPVLLLGHFDTVWNLGTLLKMPWREADGRLWGPGVLDMKTGIAHMMFALAGLREVRGALPRPVTVLLVTDEEMGSDSSRKITEAVAKKCAAVFVIEPSFELKGALKTARKGVGDFTVKVTGRAAHAGLDFQKGHSAVLELSRQILRIAGFTNLKRGITVNPGVIRGGTRTNVVADEAVAEVDLRIGRLADAAGLEEKFRSLKPVDKACKIEVSGGLNRPPLERSPAVVKLFRQAQGLARELGFKLDEAAVGGGSDGNFTAALGIPTLDGLGAVGEGAHAVNESVLISELAKRTALLARLIETV